jgi:predicted  nucleic acid-binding Zn-ribbon protein
METTSQTPRTDAEHICILNDDQIDLSREIDAMTDFARQLETELNEARAELAEVVTRMEAVTDGTIVQAYCEIDAMTDFARQLETELNEARAELAEAVTRMEAVTDGAIVQAYWSDGSWISNVRARLISAAKGEQQ